MSTVPSPTKAISAQTAPSKPLLAKRLLRVREAAEYLSVSIAGLLYLLCFEHVDNLEAYSTPSGDRPSPSKTLRSSRAGLEYD
jgi:hypothetical protein